MIHVLFSLVSAYFISLMLWRVTRVTLALGLLYALYTFVDGLIDDLLAYFNGLSEPVVGGTVIPVLGMASYVGVMHALGIILGAWMAVLLIRFSYKLLGWLA